MEKSFCNKANIVYLCPEVNCLYISNTKIINLGETLGLLFCFYILILEFALRGRGPLAVGQPSVFFIVFVNYFLPRVFAFTN